MYKFFAAILTAAVLTGVLMGGWSGKVEAHAAKSDRPYGAACSQRGWPYYEPHCLRDARPLRDIRMVMIDRLADR